MEVKIENKLFITVINRTTGESKTVETQDAAKAIRKQFFKDGAKTVSCVERYKKVAVIEH